jgi:ankyrin repeat protein
MKQGILIFLLLFCTLTTFAHKDKWDDNKKDWTELMLSIYNGETEKYQKIIKQEVDVNYATPSTNLTALEVAVRRENETAVIALLKTNKIINIEKHLMTACGQRSVSNVNQLIKYGANPNDTVKNGYSVLMMAASHGSYEILETLLKQGADVKQTRKVDGMTALMLAAYNGETKKVKLLLKYGANKYVKDLNGKTALYYIYQPSYNKKINDRETKILTALLE